MNMNKISNVFWFVISVAIGSFGMQQLTAMAGDTHLAVEEAQVKQVVLGHRIGPGNQEMIIYKQVN